MLKLVIRDIRLVELGRPVEQRCTCGGTAPNPPKAGQVHSRQEDTGNNVQLTKNASRGRK